MSDRLALLSGAAAAVPWVVSLFLLEGAGNPSGPAGGAEIVDFYRDDRTLILAAATLWLPRGVRVAAAVSDRPGTRGIN